MGAFINSAHWIGSCMHTSRSYTCSRPLIIVCQYTVHGRQYDRLSQQQLSFLYCIILYYIVMINKICRPIMKGRQGITQKKPCKNKKKKKRKRKKVQLASNPCTSCQSAPLTEKLSSCVVLCRFDTTDTSDAAVSQVSSTRGTVDDKQCCWYSYIITIIITIIIIIITVSR